MLIRHLKNHPQLAGDEVEHSSSDCETIEVNIQAAPDGKGAATSSPVPDVAAQDVSQSQGQFNSCSAIDPALEEYVERPSSPSVPNGIAHLPLLASRQHWSDNTMDRAMVDIAGPSHPQIGTAQDWSLDIQGHSHASHTSINYGSQPVPSDANFQRIRTSPNTSVGFGFGTNPYPGSMIQDQISPSMGVITQDGSMMPHELQNWFDQFDLDSHLHPDTLQAFGNSTGLATGEDRRSSTLTSDGQQTSRSPSSPSALIPNERFAKVERCWPGRRSNSLRLMPTLWWEAISKPEDNLFSNGNLSPEAMEQNRQCGSRWGLDEDCRERLQKMFITTSVAVYTRDPAAFDSPEDFASPPEGRAAEQAESITNDPPTMSNFPPAEIFDIGLDLYFRQFHPLMPFIHIPTFCPKTAPTSILSIMCLIGLTILQTKGATAFVRQAFSVSHIYCVTVAKIPKFKNNH